MDNGTISAADVAQTRHYYGRHQRRIILLVISLSGALSAVLLWRWNPPPRSSLLQSTTRTTTTTTTTTISSSASRESTTAGTAAVTIPSRRDECKPWTDESSSSSSSSSYALPSAAEYNDRIQTMWSSLSALQFNDTAWRNDTSRNISQKKDEMDERNNAPRVIVFFHIAKTGGTTIRSFLSQQLQQQQQQQQTTLPNSASKIKNKRVLELRLALKPGDFDRASHAIQKQLQSSSSSSTHDKKEQQQPQPQPQEPSLLVVEFHGQGLEPDRWADEIRLWRNLSLSEGSSSPATKEQQWARLFVFTVWRNPVDHAKSYYHYFFNHSDPAGEGFARSPIASRQCDTFRTTGRSTPTAPGNINNSQHKQQPRGRGGPMPSSGATTRQDGSSSTFSSSDSCWEAYRQLLAHMDWIGTTETIDSVTFPLLQRWINPYFSTTSSSRNNKNNSSSSNLPTDQLFLDPRNVGDYLREGSGNISSSNATAIITTEGANNITATTMIDPKLKRWIEQEASCEDYAIWRQAAASITKLPVGR